MAPSCMAFRVHCSAQRPPPPHNLDHFKLKATQLSSATIQPKGKELRQLSLPGRNPWELIKNISSNLLDALVHSIFEFVDQPLLPSQSNFAPVAELGGAVVITAVEGNIPDDFPEGVYIRNGPNPLFGGLKCTKSFFGRSSHTWIEGEGMLHALHFRKGRDGNWTVVYNNRHVETETFILEKRRGQPSFLPAMEGDSLAILAAYFFNLLRFGKANKYISNTNVFEHSGKFYSVAENHLPQEINIFSLETLRNWDVNGAWNRPFTAHPKRAPGTGELVIVGVDATKPFAELGIISADGNRLVHKSDLKLDRCTLFHEIGVTQRYNVLMDFPLTININRLVLGGPLIKYEKEGYARIGVMPRYGNPESIKWFDVQPNCTFHIINSFEVQEEVVVWGCRSLESIIPGPEKGLNKFEWFSRRFLPLESTDGTVLEDSPLFSRVYEWRLNLETGEAREQNLTGTDFSMDFPIVNAAFTGLKNNYGYAQVCDSLASSKSGMAKYGGIAKLHFEEQRDSFCSKDHEKVQGLIKVDYHMFGKNIFCTGAAFVPKEGSHEEDDGWIITFVHNEETNLSQAYIIDAKNLGSDPVAKITLPCRVPYGFHGAFMPTRLQIAAESLGSSQFSV